jgi:hypothetical protein
LFGGKKKLREAAENAARLEAFTAWFGEMERCRPIGSDVLTEDLLRAVGDPYAFLGTGAPRDDVAFLTSRYFGQEWAGRLSRKAILEGDPDAKSRSEFWKSVSNWL